MKKFLSVLLSMLTLISLIPFSAVSAGAEDSVTSDGFSYSILDDGSVKITGYNGGLTEVRIPESIDDKAVTGIAAMSFYGYDTDTGRVNSNASITSIFIPASVTNIDDYAFEYTVGMVSFSVDENNKAYCAENGVLFDKDKTKLICYPATKADEPYTIPEGITEIGIDSFAYTDNLKEVVFPKTLKKIGDHSFYGSGLTSVTLNEGLESIGNNAFKLCVYLENIYIPSTLKSIGDDVFKNSGKLSAINYNGTQEQWNSIEKGSDEQRDKTKINFLKTGPDKTDLSALLETAKSITKGNISDESYTALQEAIKSAESVNTNDNASDDEIAAAVEGLNTAISNLVENGDAAEDFEYTTLEDGTVEITGYIGSSTEVIIPSHIDGAKVTSIADYAFTAELETDPSMNITSLTIPCYVTNIGSYAFEICWSLNTINVSPLNTVYTDVDGIVFTKDMKQIVSYPEAKESESYSIPEGVETICSGAFELAYVNTVVIPESVKTIEEYAFYGCYISNINIPDTVTSIGEGAFDYCIYLESITLPNGLNEIPDCAFSYCYSLYDNVSYGLKTITIPDSVTRIGEEAFLGCEILSSINIPANVTDIGAKAFDSCTALKDIYYAGTSADWEKITINEGNTKLLSGDVTIHYQEDTDPTVDMTDLKNKIDEAKKIDAGEYTDETAAELAKALEAAEEVYNNSAASQEQITKAYEELTKAINNLDKKGDVPTPPTGLFGDVDGSGDIGTGDVTLVLQYIAGIVHEGDEGYDHSVSDVTGDEVTDTQDVTAILQYIATIITEFPVEG